MDTTSVLIPIPAGVDPVLLAGPSESVLRAVEGACAASVSLRGDSIVLKGPSVEVDSLVDVFSRLLAVAREGVAVDPGDAVRLYEDALAGSDCGRGGEIIVTHHGRSVRPKTAGQARYVRAIENHTITFGIGPAGTGKTYLAMALAVAALKRQEIGRIILTRPVVEAGESLGFLPGTLEEKIDPYVRPLFDALFDLVDPERAQALLDKGVVEIAPLAYMRGRTLNDAFVILDEAQNTTCEQMKMFLTRLGFNSKFVITGDASQRDLIGRQSGLLAVEDILGDVDDICFVHLGRRDVVRHRLVGAIVQAYDTYENARTDARRYAGGDGHGRSHQ